MNPQPPPPPEGPTQPGDRLEALFHSALGRAPVDREAYLAEACAGDDDLLSEVHLMLQAHEEAGDFLTAQAPSPAVQAEMARLKAEEMGERIGPYKLLQQIGEGGFGTVWMAEQEQPVRRRVALKIIKLGMDTKEVVARFEQERQALAMMDHPNIAKVFDAGATPTGRPYFVMELVRGIKITDYCDQASLPTAERLHLFIAVCHAVQHAHQKGIIHRDIKPSNILVTLHDGVPVPKVIDFGVAKATQQRLTDLTLFTQFEQMIGTPLYMSPEQAEMSGLDIDTRTDIYALGVLLYELLTGRTPFDPKELLKRGLDEIRRAIREQEPPRPSTALSTMAAAAMTAVAQNRRSDSAKLIGLLRGDLDWIVMKALEKNRTRRYDTANAFAEDIQRHLASEPVVACPPSFGYTAGKFIRKHKGPVMTAALVALALIAGLAASTVLYQREKSALAVAESSRAKAETSTQTAMSEAAKSAQMANFLAEMFRRMDAAKGQDITLMKAMLDEASKRATELQDQPAVEAQLRQTIGGAYLALGLTGEAQQQFDLYRMLQQRVPESEYLNSIKAMREQARLYWQDGKPALAETLCRQILDISQRVLGPDHPETLAAMTDLAWAYVQAGKSDEAVHLYRKKLQIANDARGPTHIDTLQALDDLAFHSMGSGKYADALPLYVQLLERAKRTLEPGHPLIFQTTSQLDFVYAQLGMYAEEEPMALAAYAGIRKYEDSGGHAPMTTTQGTVLLHDTLLRLVNLYNALAKPDEAAKWQQKLDAYDQAAAARKNSTPADAAPAKP